MIKFIYMIMLLITTSSCALEQKAIERKQNESDIIMRIGFITVNNSSDLKKASSLVDSAIPYMGSKGNAEINKGIIGIMNKQIKIFPHHVFLEGFVPLYKKDKKHFDELIKEVLTESDQKKFYDVLKTALDPLPKGE